MKDKNFNTASCKGTGDNSLLSFKSLCVVFMLNILSLFTLEAK